MVNHLIYQNIQHGHHVIKITFVNSYVMQIKFQHMKFQGHILNKTL